MAKIKVEEHNGEKFVRYWCPGCKYEHAVEAVRWNWNGSFDAPTLSPSVKHYYTITDSGDVVTTCHYHIRGGVIEFCNDCKHDLKGKKVPLQDVSEV